MAKYTISDLNTVFKELDNIDDKYSKEYRKLYCQLTPLFDLLIDNGLLNIKQQEYYLNKMERYYPISLYMMILK